MNIMVPISKYDDIEEFCECGADELYFGFYDELWEQRFGTFEEINRMSSFGSSANFNIKEIDRVARKIKECGKKAFLTLNSSTYSMMERNYLTAKMQELYKVDFDGIIIGDPAMIDVAKMFQCPIVLSTMMGIYNSDIIDFYYKLGIKRMIIPRDIQIRDIESMVKKYPDIEFEVFLMRNGCKYSDSNCMSYHGRKYGSMCSCIDNGETEICISKEKEKDINWIKEVYSNNNLFTKAFHKRACGICALKLFYKLGIKSVKIVGRADNSHSVAEDIKIIRQAIEAIETDRELDIQDGHLFKDCLYGVNCYYTC